MNTMATTEQLVSQHPFLYHMAAVGSWKSIQEHGLLSTTALLDHFEVQEPTKSRLNSEWRPNSVVIKPGLVIRDQRPMPTSSLTKALVGLNPSQWYEFLNSKTFFWPTRSRLNKMLNARLYREELHDVITVDTRELLARHGSRVWLSPINSGFALFGTPLRGTFTFKSIEEYPSIRRNTDVAEVAVQYHVPDIREISLRVERWRGSLRLETIWESEACED